MKSRFFTYKSASDPILWEIATENNVVWHRIGEDSGDCGEHPDSILYGVEEGYLEEIFPYFEKIEEDML